MNCKGIAGFVGFLLNQNFVSDVEQTSVHTIFYTQILGLEVIAVVDFSAALLCSRS